jgi:hypothetical protein
LTLSALTGWHIIVDYEAHVCREGATMFTLVVFTSLLVCGEKPAWPLLGEFTSEGLAIPGGPKVKLRVPAMSEGLSAPEQKKVVRGFEEQFPPKLFLRRSPTAPYKLEVKSIEEKGKKRRGHMIDLWFVAYGTIDQLEKDDALDQLLAMRRKGAKKRTYLTAGQLKERKIAPMSIPRGEERFFLLDAVLIDRVQLNGVMRSQRIKTGKTLTLASMLDGRFQDDKEHPNRWRSIKQKPGEEPTVGEPEPYTGFGGYVKATELAEPKGALFIEMHFAFHEPYNWFNGFNLLAPKLPLAVRDNVMSMRRKLASGK